MITFLFWNLHRNHLAPYIANLSAKYQVDVCIFAECIITPRILLESLNATHQHRYYYVPQIGCTKIHIATRFDPTHIETIEEEDRITLRRLRIPNTPEILLVAAHLPDKLSKGGHEAQNVDAAHYGNMIRQAEFRLGHQRTLLVGDLNMNPFDFGMVYDKGFNGTMSRVLSEKRLRQPGRKAYPFFYNPMWNLLGDISLPSGTYYSAASYNPYHWNLYDQVLLRPALLPHFNPQTDLEIITSDGKNALVSRAGLPRKTISDHLPLLFRLHL